MRDTAPAPVQCYFEDVEVEVSEGKNRGQPGSTVTLLSGLPCPTT